MTAYRRKAARVGKHDCFAPIRLEMRGNYPHQFATVNDLGAFPKSREVAPIARDEVIGARLLGAL